MNEFEIQIYGAFAARTARYQWEHLFSVPGCHRWFSGIKPDGMMGIAVADGSGETPDQTDDGVLWLDKSVPMMCDSYRELDTCGDFWQACEIPLLDDEGKRHWLGGSNLREAKSVTANVSGTRIVYKMVGGVMAKLGRPPKAVKEINPVRQVGRWTDSDWQLIRDAAESRGENVAQFCKAVLIRAARRTNVDKKEE